MPNALIPIASRALANDANTGDEIARAGAGLGELVRLTGEAIAATQNRLNETGAASASALATTLADIIAVREKVYRDNGTLDTVKTHVRRLPLITFIDPVFYQWTSVRLQGLFFASEFSAETTSTSSTHSSSFGTANAGWQVWLGAGYFDQKSSDSSSTTTSTEDQDLSVGLMRMNALLEPRADIGIPKPAQVIRGPILSLIQGEITDVPAAGSEPAARTLSMLIQYNRRDGAAIANKAIALESGGLLWSYADGPTAVTNASGQVEIELKRVFTDPAADTTPADFVISARIGMVSNSVTVTF